jgi:hypothetical protein
MYTAFSRPEFCYTTRRTFPEQLSAARSRPRCSMCWRLNRPVQAALLCAMYRRDFDFTQRLLNTSFSCIHCVDWAKWLIVYWTVKTLIDPWVALRCIRKNLHMLFTAGLGKNGRIYCSPTEFIASQTGCQVSNDIVYICSSTRVPFLSGFVGLDVIIQLFSDPGVRI